MSVKQSVQYTFDELNRLSAVTYGSGGRIIYTYDPAGNPTSVTFSPTATEKPAVCTKCGHPLEPGKSFCANCGSRQVSSAPPMERLCPTCSRIVPAGRKFCTADGTPVPEVQSRTTEDMTRLVRAAPPERRCPKCNMVIPAGNKFCTEDGTPLP
jgi:YD repeat-containing protein